MKTQLLTHKETPPLKVKECPRCLFTSDIVHIPGMFDWKRNTSPSMYAQCEYCDLQDTLRAHAHPEDWFPVLDKIKKSGKGKQYDSLIGISGGEDSSVMLYMATKLWGLRPLVIHFNNRWNRPEADNNIRVLTKELDVNFIEYFLDQNEYDKLTDSFLMAGVQDADIANDISMAKLMYTAARQYGIKYILNGHDFAREGSSPAAWSYMDAKYLQSVYKKWTGKELKNYPLYTFWDQILSALIGIKQVRPYHYMPNFDRKSILILLKAIGWKDYGGKHNENIYTAFVGGFLLPNKFGIDKRITYLSAQIREGYITKEYAREILEQPANFHLEDLGDKGPHILNLVNASPKGNRSDYGKYNFKAWKPLIWLLAKMEIVPWTFYKKYT